MRRLARDWVSNQFPRKNQGSRRNRSRELLTQRPRRDGYDSPVSRPFSLRRLVYYIIFVPTRARGSGKKLEKNRKPPHAGTEARIPDFGARAATSDACLLGLPLRLGLVGVWIGFLLDENLRGVILTRRWHSLKWFGKSFT